MTEQRKKMIQVITVSAVIFLVLLFSALIINLVGLAQANSQRNRLAAEAARLEQLIKHNENEIFYRDSDAFIERHAREYLGMKKKDEDSFLPKPY